MIYIKSPYFTAAVILTQSGIVEDASPILRYMKGWPERAVLRYAERKGWVTQVI